MHRILWSFCLLLLPGLLSAQTEPHYVRVKAGDVAALTETITAANARNDGIPTVIKLGGTFSFAGKVSLPPIESDISIRGYYGPGIFDGGGAGPAQLLRIAENAQLTLANLEFRNFSIPLNGPGLIENAGSMDVRKVQFIKVVSKDACLPLGCRSVTPLLVNHTSGRVQMNQVSFVDSGGISQIGGGMISNAGDMVLVNMQLYLPGHGWSPPLLNNGSLTIASSSLKYARNAATTPLRLLNANGGGTMEVANSVFGGFSGDWCAETVTHGYNLHDAADCAWSGTGDLTGVPAGLLWRPVEARWGSGFEPEILTHALVPLAASAAVDSAGEAYCPSISLLSDSRAITDGNGDGQAGCDRGAVELTPIGLAEGGINGLYSVPGAGGHYVYILQNDYNTLVVWNTFDADGNPVWVYGIGELQNGRSLVADTYINRDGSVSLSGELEPAQDEHWGTLEIDMSSCTEGTVGYYSDLPEFGSGQFSIQRLAYVKQLGCIDL